MRQNEVLLMRDAQLVERVAFSARSATTSICSAVQSPGAPPIGFSEIVTDA